MPDGTNRTTLKVALVNMPFSSARFPSIQLGLLQSILAERGFAARAHYFNLEYAARVGWKRYEALSDSTMYFVGDWIFSRAAFRDSAPDGRRFLDRFGRKLSKTGAEFLWEQHEHDAGAFVDDCASSVPWHHYDVVGFSSVFVQNCAALALARTLKERHPHLITVFGGANFEDEMGLEYVRALPWVDYAVLGEADESFPALLERLASGLPVLSMPGIAHRVGDRVDFGGAPQLLRNLDRLPVPNYDDYFATGARLRMPSTLVANGIQLPYESARGCWWGEKHHCTFCGLNAMGMSYRSKSAPRVLSEIDELAQRYRTNYLGAVDNIMDHRHINGVFGVLAERRQGYHFFYEVKANLRREQIHVLARGGMRRIQPGIESLNSHVLQLMRKGITAIKNVRLLKWATYYGVHVSWNMLFGFPGEEQADYDVQVKLISQILHFAPPTGAFRISLERFSPNYSSAAEMGFHNVRPLETYSYIYPKELDLRRIAYFFEFDARDTLADTAYNPLRRAIDQWRKRWGITPKPFLTYDLNADGMTICDGRRPTEPLVHLFDARAARIYESCSSTDRSLSNIVDELRMSDPQADSAEVERVLIKFVSLGLLFEEGGHFLSLATPEQPDLSATSKTENTARMADASSPNQWDDLLVGQS